MKKKNLNKIITSILASASLVLAVSPVSNVYAAGKKVKSVMAAESDNGLNIRYMGEGHGYVFIKISVAQAVEQKSYLQIFDFSGEKLYEEAVTAKDFSRIIKVSPEELRTLHVSWLRGDNETKKTFAINASVTAKYELAEVAE